MRYVVLLVRRPGATGFEVFICQGEPSLELPAGRYSTKHGRVLNEEPIGESEFELILRLRENSPLFQKALRAYQDFIILAGREPLEASA